VCDFGLAFTEGLGLTRITQTGTGLGTPEYMAPEQIEGRRVDSRADIYSLGVLMYEAFTGELPFVGENAAAIIMQHLNRAPLPPSTRNETLPTWLERIILRAMEKEPSRRFQSVQELRERLEPSPSGRRIETHPITGDKIVSEERGEGVRLTIHAQHERSDWSGSVAIRLGERFYKVVRSSVAGTSTHPFVYVLEAWPDSEVLRKILDYEASVTAAQPGEAKWGGIKKLFKRTE
jgi:serine/threonine protein kinase